MDLISRQTVIDAIGERPMVWTGDNEYDLGCVSQYDLDKLAIEAVPSVDAVEVVRCKDCKHWMPYDWMFSEVWRSVSMDDYSDDEIGCAYCDMNMHANDFCSRAERRTDG